MTLKVNCHKLMITMVWEMKRILLASSIQRIDKFKDMSIVSVKLFTKQQYFKNFFYIIIVLFSFRFFSKAPNRHYSN